MQPIQQPSPPPSPAPDEEHPVQQAQPTMAIAGVQNVALVPAIAPLPAPQIVLAAQNFAFVAAPPEPPAPSPEAMQAAHDLLDFSTAAHQQTEQEAASTVSGLSEYQELSALMREQRAFEKAKISNFELTQETQSKYQALGIIITKPELPSSYPEHICMDNIPISWLSFDNSKLILNTSKLSTRHFAFYQKFTQAHLTALVERANNEIIPQKKHHLMEIISYLTTNSSYRTTGKIYCTSHHFINDHFGKFSAAFLTAATTEQDASSLIATVIDSFFQPTREQKLLKLNKVAASIKDYGFIVKDSANLLPNEQLLLDQISLPLNVPTVQSKCRHLNDTVLTEKEIRILTYFANNEISFSLKKYLLAIAATYLSHTALKRLAGALLIPYPDDCYQAAKAFADAIASADEHRQPNRVISAIRQLQQQGISLVREQRRRRAQEDEQAHPVAQRPRFADAAEGDD